MTEQEHHNNRHYPLSFLSGMLLGGLAGAATMLLLAPQSGEKTRDQIQHKGIELREQTTKAIDTAAAQIRQTAGQIGYDVRNKVEVFQQQGQELFDEQRERLTTAVDGKNKDVEISK